MAGATPPRGPLLVLGDSLSAEYGLKRGDGWVTLLAARLAKRRPPVDVINASISGETTAGGRSRIEALLRAHRPSWVLVELGANDALRGLDLDGTAANLRAIAGAASTTGARVVLVGMRVPPNYGRAYSERFAGLFRSIADEGGHARVPFLLEGFADRAEWFQPDRIHPNSDAQATMLANVWPVLEKELARR